MKRKEINIFSTAFLDLLSGALGAVLILFIIIPKLTSEQQNALEELDRLNVQSEQLAELIELARNSIPAELYGQIQAQMRQMQNTINQLTQTVQNLQQQLQRAESENTQLREQLAQTQQQLQDARDCIRENAQLRDQLAETQRQLQDAQRRLEEAKENIRKRDGLPSSLMHKGEVEVFILWEENVDVDLYVKNLDNGEICQHPNSRNSHPNVKSWGILTEDINHERLRGDGIKYYEIFYQPKPVPGKYQIYFNIYQSNDGTHWNGKPATVSGFVVMFPDQPNEIRIDFPTVTLTRALEDHIVGTLTVTENKIILEQ